MAEKKPRRLMEGAINQATSIRDRSVEGLTKVCHFDNDGNDEDKRSV